MRRQIFIEKKMSKKAQSLVELAILGPLVLVALGFLVAYICKLNNDQYALMQAFRYGLAQSHTDNKVVAFGTWDDRRMASVQQPIIGRKITSSGAGYVYWAIPSTTDAPQRALYIKINLLPPIDVTQAGSGAISPRYFTFTDSKIEVNNVNGTITSSRSGTVVETMIYKVGGKKNGMIIPYARGHSRRR